MLENKRIGFIGGGQMCEAILRGALDSGKVKPASLHVTDVSEERLAYLAEEYGVETVLNGPDEGGVSSLASKMDLLVLALKPQFAGPVLPLAAKAAAPGLPVFSIMGGVDLATLEAHFRGPVVRAMPNTPAQVRRGSTGIAAGRKAREEDMALAEELFSLVGSVYRLPENLIDPLTGLSGCGPAFASLFIEALADGGVEQGLPRHMALKLAAETLAGTADMMLQTGRHPALLKDAVTSPGGGTIAGVHALESGGFRAAVMDAVGRACERMTELGRQAGV